MCLFSIDIYSECKHVQCNLIRAIQLQNTTIFPQAQNISNDSSMPLMNGYHHNGNQSQSVVQNHSHATNRVGQEKEATSNQYVVKQEGQQMGMLGHSQQQGGFGFEGHIGNEKVMNGNANGQGVYMGMGIVKAQQERIQSLQMQVMMLKNGMGRLVTSLKDKKVLNEREYQEQMKFLEQFEGGK